MSKEETMVERVARAIAASFDRDPDECVHGSGGTGIESVCHMRMWQTYLPTARAVIDALMEPSDELLEAAGLINDDSGTPYVSDFNYFRSQLRAMLSQAKEQGK